MRSVERMSSLLVDEDSLPRNGSCSDYWQDEEIDIEDIDSVPNDAVPFGSDSSGGKRLPLRSHQGE